MFQTDLLGRRSPAGIACPGSDGGDDVPPTNASYCATVALEALVKQRAVC